MSAFFYVKVLGEEEKLKTFILLAFLLPLAAQKREVEFRKEECGPALIKLHFATLVSELKNADLQTQLKNVRGVQDVRTTELEVEITPQRIDPSSTHTSRNSEILEATKAALMKFLASRGVYMREVLQKPQKPNPEDVALTTTGCMEEGSGPLVAKKK